MARSNKLLQRDASTAPFSSIFFEVKLEAARSARLNSGVRLPSNMIPAEVAFELILKAVESPLARAGFSRVEEKSHPEAFGSRYTTFGNSKEFIRLTWDGKERWFVLESIPANSATFEYGWIDILLQFFRPPENEAEDAAEIAEDMRGALCAYLGAEE